MPSERPLVAAIVAEGDDPPPGIHGLSGLADVRIARSVDDAIEAVREADAMLVWDFRSELVPKVWPSARRLRWIHAASAGVDAVMTPEVAASDVVVTNSRGVFDDAMAEWVLAVVLLFAKDLGTSIELQRRHEWKHRESERVGGRSVLIYGAGSVGRAVGRLLRAVGMEVTGVARRERDDPDLGRVAGAEELRDRIGGADFVVITAPLTDATRGAFDERTLAACKPGARLINVGRGPIVDEDALVEALRSGRISGAALDVFVTEPLPADHPFWSMDNVLVSPHQCGDVVGWRHALVDLFETNLRRFIAGEDLMNVVDAR